MKVVASWDDGTAEDLAVAELMAKYDIDAIFYLPARPNLVNELRGRDSLNSAQRQELAQSFEIGSHTISHPLLTRIPVDQAREEIVNSKTMLREELGVEITKFAYPRGYANSELQVMAQEAGYYSARSTLVGYIHESENPYFEQTSVHVGCNRKEYGGKSWLEYARYMLGQAKKTPNSVFHFWGHSWELSQNPNGLKQLETLLKELA